MIVGIFQNLKLQSNGPSVRPKSSWGHPGDIGRTPI